MITSKFFKEEEFKRCVPPCSLQDMQQEHINTLDRIRQRAGISISLNSAYRSTDWEKSKGRTGSGDHPQGNGTDLAAPDSATKYKILKAAIEEGVRRIGIAKTFIHIGTSKTLAQGVVWLY